MCGGNLAEWRTWWNKKLLTSATNQAPAPTAVVNITTQIPAAKAVVVTHHDSRTSKDDGLCKSHELLAMTELSSSTNVSQVLCNDPRVTCPA